MLVCNYDWILILFCLLHSNFQFKNQMLEPLLVKEDFLTFLKQWLKILAN